MPRGGRRSGKPGASYANRSDLNSAARGPLAPKAPAGMQYGAAKASLDAQRSMPMGPPGSTGPAVGSATGAPPDASADPTAGARAAMAGLVPLGAPTQRPDEPLTSGIDSGSGAGSGALIPQRADMVGELRALYARYPNEDLRELLEDEDMAGG